MTSMNLPAKDVTHYVRQSEMAKLWHPALLSDSEVTMGSILHLILLPAVLEKDSFVFKIKKHSKINKVLDYS